MLARICSSVTRASHASRAFARLTHLCLDDQLIHVRTVVSSTPLDFSCCRGADVMLPCGLTDGSAGAEGDVGAEGRVGFSGFRGEAVPVYQRLIEERCAKVDHWQNSPRSHQRAGRSGRDG